MNAVDFLRVAPLINDCPNCGSDLVGNGEGTISVDDNMIERTCKCGFRFKYDVNEGVSKTKIKKVIEKSLATM